MRNILWILLITIFTLIIIVNSENQKELNHDDYHQKIIIANKSDNHSYNTNHNYSRNNKPAIPKKYHGLRMDQITQSLNTSDIINQNEIFEHDFEEPEVHHETRYEPSHPLFWFYLFASIFLCLFAGLCSGLTVGYLSIDELQLDIKCKTGTDQDRAYAAVIIPVITKHHQLLSTLLVANAFAMETLPICLDSIVPAWLAITLSTSFVVIFGEVLPQAYCTGPDQIKIAAKMAPIVNFLMLILYPICKPLGLYLDHLLGEHHQTRFVKKDLKALIELHQIQKSHPDASHGGIASSAGLTPQEIKVINSTIDLRETPVTKEMESIEKVIMLSDTTVITSEVMKKIAKTGFSKIPVFRGKNKNQIVGMLKTKSLIDYHEKYLDQTIKESGIKLLAPLVVPKDTSMLEMLMIFQEKKTAIAMVSDDIVKNDKMQSLFSNKFVLDEIKNKETKLIGLISLKDIFEEILESKLVDDDVHAAFTLHSGAGTTTKRDRMTFGMTQKIQLQEISEAAESTEKNLKKPLLKQP